MSTHKIEVRSVCRRGKKREKKGKIVLEVWVSFLFCFFVSCGGARFRCRVVMVHIYEAEA
jgi:hypothetical protein